MEETPKRSDSIVHLAAVKHMYSQTGRPQKNVGNHDNNLTNVKDNLAAFENVFDGLQYIYNMLLKMFTILEQSKSLKS